MPQGLEIYDAAGVLKLNSSNKITRIVSYFDTGVAAGSTTLLNDPAIEYFTVLIPSSVDNLCPPTASVSGNVVSWDWLDPRTAWRTSAMLIIGAM